MNDETTRRVTRIDGQPDPSIPGHATTILIADSGSLQVQLRWIDDEDRAIVGVTTIRVDLDEAGWRDLVRAAHQVAESDRPTTGPTGDRT